MLYGWRKAHVGSSNVLVTNEIEPILFFIKIIELFCTFSSKKFEYIIMASCNYYWIYNEQINELREVTTRKKNIFQNKKRDRKMGDGKDGVFCTFLLLNLTAVLFLTIKNKCIFFSQQ